MLPIYSAFTSDINSLPRLACYFLPKRKRVRVCVYVCVCGLLTFGSQTAADSNGILCFQPFVSV